MRLQTELQKVKINSGATFRRNKYGQQRSWSSSEKLYLKTLAKELNNEETIQNQLNQLSVNACPDWPKVDLDVSELSSTIQQLKMEILKLTQNGKYYFFCCLNIS